MRYVLFVTLCAVAISGCIKVGESAPAPAASTQQNCSIVENDVYSLGVDPTAGDFNVSSIDDTGTVVTNTCSSTTGSATVKAYNVQRTGNSIILMQNSTSTASQLAVNGTAVTLGVPINVCSNGVQVTETVSNGILNASAKTMSMTFTVTLVKNNCTSTGISKSEQEGLSDRLLVPDEAEQIVERWISDNSHDW